MSEENGEPKTPTTAVVQNMAEFAANVVTLAELQTQLAAVELRDWVRSIVRPAVLVAGAALVALGCIPVLLLSFAYVLIEFAGLSHALSLLIATLAGLTIAGTVGAIGFSKLRSHSLVLERSREEFNQNVKWIKEVLKQKSIPKGADCKPTNPWRRSRQISNG